MAYREGGDAAALERGRAIIAMSGSLAASDRERLEGHFRGAARRSWSARRLADGDVQARRPGRHEDEQELRQRDRPARGARGITRQSDGWRPIHRESGAPTRATRRSARSWQLHKVYSNEETQAWFVTGCKTAAIGCLDCKQPVIEAILREQAPWRERARAGAVPDQSEAGALDRRGRHRAGAHGGARDDARSARRDGAVLLAIRSLAPTGRERKRDGVQCRAARPPFVDAARAAGAALLPIRLSVPAKRRLMFAPWRQIRRPEMTSSASAIASGPSVRTCQNGANTAATSEAGGE